MSKIENKRCSNCLFLCHQDSGYSNWTVMETYLNCLKGKFEDIEDSYPQDLESDFYKQAENCEHFLKGQGASFDVDGEVTIADYADNHILYNALRDAGYR